MPNRNDGSNPNYLPIPPHCAPPSCPDHWRLTGICPDCADSLQARVAELEAELPDDYSESKDWKQGNAVSRIQWLKAMMESYRFEVERLETQLLGNPE